MRLQKILASISLLTILAPISVNIASADTTPSDMKTVVLQDLQTLIQQYEDRISALQTQNKILSDEIQTLKAGGQTAISTGSITPVSTGSTTSPTSTNTSVVINT